jgi:Mg-chelatase subunit ChlD/2'-5' RNA ligase
MTAEKAKLDTCCALTVVLPPFPVVQRLREKYDPAYSRWPGHFNVDCFPFYGGDKHAALLPLIQSVAAKLRPFTIRLASVACFEGKNGVMYAAVEDVDGGATQLHAKLMAEFPQLNTTRAFQPHVTLGRFTNSADMKSTAQALNLVWEPIVFEVTCLSLITRPRDGAFVVAYEFPLGGDAWRQVTRGNLSDCTGTTVMAAAPTGLAGLNPSTCVGVAVKAPATGFGAAEGACVGTIAPALLQSSAATAATATATGFRLGLHWVCRIKPAAAAPAAYKKRMMNVIVVDNSASMGNLAKAAIETIGHGMYQFGDAVDSVPGIVIAFSQKAEVLSNCVRDAHDVARLMLPPQHNTNITAGVRAAVEEIVAAAPPLDTHIVMTLLSDGAHNEGPPITDDMLARWRMELRGWAITVIVVGVGATSDTSLGMKIKTGLETVAPPGLNSIYYTRSAYAMKEVLAQLQHGLKEHVAGGAALHVRCATHTFMDTGTNSATPYVEGDDMGATVILKSADVVAMPPLFTLASSGEMVPFTQMEIDPTLLTQALDVQVQRLSQLRVARGAVVIRSDLDELKTLIQACTAAITATARSEETSSAWASLTSKRRTAALKAYRRTECSFREHLNRLEELRCGVANDSSQQAAFLTGMQRKYGAKAVRRAAVVDTAIGDVLGRIADTVRLFEDLDVEATGAATTAVSTTLASVDTSFMSLNTPKEQLQEWRTVDPTTCTEPYEVLVAYGMCGFPVRMLQTAAAQMDPWQTACLDVEPYLVDTGSLLLANQTGQVIMGPTRQPVQDAIVVVFPECETASRAAVRSVVNEYLCSVAVCRDLYMFNPSMILAMHGHVFLTAVRKCVSADFSSAYLHLALQLLYSMRVVHGGGVFNTLLRHWLQDWGGLTTSKQDDCKHPLQAIVGLATATYIPAAAAASACAGGGKEGGDVLVASSSDWDVAAASASSMGATPLLTLLCEVVSRRCRGVVRGANVNPYEVLGAMYGINADNSPTATADPMATEPPEDVVRRKCLQTHTLRPTEFPSCLFDGVTSVHSWVRGVIEPYYHAFCLGHVLQRLRVWSKDVPNASVFLRQPDIAREFGMMPTDPFTFMGVVPTDANMVLEAMFAQGMLYNEAGKRVTPGKRHNSEAGVGAGAAAVVFETAAGDGEADDGATNDGLADVREPGCLRELLADVHMEHYATSCAEKRSRWQAMIGDVTTERALSANPEQFQNMLGPHTHALSRKVFWSLVRVANEEAAQGNPAKKRAFLERSNVSVPRCFACPKKAFF